MADVIMKDTLKPEQLDPKEVVKAMQKSMEVGQVWYLVSAGWFRKFKATMGSGVLESGDRDGYTRSPNKSSDLSDDLNPGPIDNSSILDSGFRLKSGLIDEIHYVMVPEESWVLLKNAYGVKDGDKAIIPRKVIETGAHVKQRRVEVYYLHLKLSMYPALEKFEVQEFSTKDKFDVVRRRMFEIFKVAESADARFWLKNSFPADYVQIKSMTATLDNCELSEMDVVVMEIRPSGTTNWPMHRVVQKEDLGRYSSRRSVQPGLCGLQNLGNTCFMNSILQCMSNTPPMTAYFLSEQHLKELNTENPLGTRGELAKSYGDLVAQMWSGTNATVAPRNFKTQVGRYAPQFSGYLQQDASELLIFLLDGLHEDLNRIRKKPYIELKEADGREDRVVAKEAWDNYLKRNDSILVEIFHGLIKSTLVCPECNKISVTFDPNPPWALPLPFKREKVFNVVVVSRDPAMKPNDFRLALPRDATVRELPEILSRCGDVSALCKITEKSHLMVATVSNGSFSRIFEPSDRVSEGMSQSIYIYDVGPETDKSTVVPVKFRKMQRSGGYVREGWVPFGMPFFIRIKKTSMTVKELTKILTNHMARVYEEPEPGVRWWDDDVDMRAVNGVNGESSSDADEEIQPFKLHFLKLDGTFIEKTTQKTPGKTEVIHFPTDENYCIAVDWNSLALSKGLLNESAITDCHKVSGILNDQSKTVIKLTDCFRLFTQKETLRGDNAWYCPRCKIHQEATKKIDIWTLPNILIVQLKRFSYTRYNRDKIEVYVEYPVKGLDLSEFVISPDHPEPIYDLIGVSNHYGGLGGGHYTAYARNKDDGHWYHFDDSCVQRVSDKDVVSKAGYVLFYQRRGSRVATRYPSISAEDRDKPVQGGVDVW